MSEQLETVKETATETTNPEVVQSTQQVEAQSQQPEEKQPWQVAMESYDKRIADIEAKHQAEIQRMQHGMNKSFGKLRNQVDTYRKMIDTIVPEPKREQFTDEAQFQQAKKVVEPIRTQFSQLEEQTQRAEREAVEAEQRNTLVQSVVSKVSALPAERAGEISQRYQQALQMGQQMGVDMDVDNDILQFVSSVDNGADVLDAIYQNPQTVLTLKAQPLMGKIAMLMNISKTAQTLPSVTPSAPIAAQATVSEPARPIKTSGSGLKAPTSARTAQEYLQMRLAQRK
jgi:hypothetical protein